MRHATIAGGLVGRRAGPDSAGICAQSPPAAHSEWRTPWSYEGANGADHWGDLDPEYATCKTGREQSPIDIHGAAKASLAALRFEYKGAPLAHFVNNGYTVRVNYPAGNGNVLVVGDTRYELTQFHFHRPSEEYVLTGKTRAIWSSSLHAFAAGTRSDTGRRSIGHDGPREQRLPSNCMRTCATESWRRCGRSCACSRLNPSWPPAAWRAPTYVYQGSLTAPPCREGVTWYVLKAPVTLSPEQINAFAALYPHDVRPLQPLNGRVVHESE